jgi:hypothetical protein
MVMTLRLAVLERLQADAQTDTDIDMAKPRRAFSHIFI